MGYEPRGNAESDGGQAENHPRHRLNDPAQRLDLYHSVDHQPDAPLIIWVHGGAWRSGTKSDVPIADLLNCGFAIVSVDYRLTPQAPFPALVHDIKAAIRFLLSRAVEYGVDAQRFFFAGASAGGHLAALAGVSAGVEDLEEDGQSKTSGSSAVAAIVSLEAEDSYQNRSKPSHKVLDILGHDLTNSR